MLEKSSRNIPGIKVLRAEGLNVYDILRTTVWCFWSRRSAPLRRRCRERLQTSA
jgi:hypothetical protein